MPRRFFVRRFTRRIVTMSFVGLIAAVAVWVTVPRETAAVAADSVASLEQATWQAEYFANATLSGTPVATRSETGAPNYDWGAGHPADLALPNDKFSARWTVTHDFDNGGPIDLTVTGQDGLRVYVDGRRVIDKWKDVSSPVSGSARVQVSAGRHEVKLEYFAGKGNAAVKLAVAAAKPANGHAFGAYTAEYFDNTTLKGAPATTAFLDPGLDIVQNWGAGGPDGVGADNFSARWTQERDFGAGGSYTFTATFLGGFRVYVDNKAVLNNFAKRTKVETKKATYTMPAGFHTVRAEFWSGTGNASLEFRVASPTLDTTAPATPKGVKAAGGQDGIVLTWDANSEADLAGYLVYRSDKADGAYIRLTETPVPGTQFADRAAPSEQPSYFRVVAVDKAGNASTAATVDATRPAAPDTAAPATPAGLKATATQDAIALTWDANSEGDVAGYLVYRSDTVGGAPTKLTSTPIAEPRFDDADAPREVASVYRVTAVDKAGNESEAATAEATRPAVPAPDTTPPETPAGLTATAGQDGVVLTWEANGEPDLAGYMVARADAADGTFEPLTTEPIQAARFNDASAPRERPSFYRVTAVDKSGNESHPATADATRPPAPDVTAPTGPVGLTTSAGDGSVELSWIANREDDVAGYNVYRATEKPVATSAGNRLNADLVTATRYTDASAQNKTTYAYVVTAVDKAGNESPASPPVDATPMTLPPHDSVVAADGSGDHLTLAAALAAAPANSTTPYTIVIKPGAYREVVNVAKPFITLVGATRDPADVVISYDNAAGTFKTDGTGTYGTTGSATMTIRGNNVSARDLTIANTFDEASVELAGGEQAVALKTIGDRLSFENVRLLGNQDTLYADSPSTATIARSYYRNSYIEGDVDFVFGRGTAVFDHSTLKALNRGSTSNNGYVTAASTDKANRFGFLITDSRIVSDAPAASFHLGRPWQPSNDAAAIAQVVVRDTEIPTAIKAAPWTDMTATFSWRNARFFEYRNTGPGSGASADRPQLTEPQAAQYTKFTYLTGSDAWNPTGETPPPPPADTTAPAAPAGLQATPRDSNVTLSWTANTEDDLEGYDVYRSTTDPVETVSANKLNDARVTSTAYTDRTAANGTDYHYAVVAVDKAGNESTPSAGASASPVGATLPPHDILVAQDGSGKHTTIQAALDAAPAGTAAKPTVIAVKPGTYRELVNVQKNYVTLIGTTGNPSDVVITYDNAAKTINPATNTAYGTGNSQTMLVKGNNVTVRDVTLENAFKETGASSEQAVALKTTGDRLRFDNIRLLGNQDTLLVDSGDANIIARSYFTDSYIEGDVDFIFGRGTAVFERCTIKALSRGSSSNNGYVTAASTADKNPYGILIANSKITSDAPAKSFHLGRPWRGWADGYVKNGVTYNSRGQVTVRNTDLTAAIKDAPWTDMPPNLWTDGRFFEYQNTGPGAGVNASRPQLTDEQATEYTPQKYLAGTDGWNPVG